MKVNVSGYPYFDDYDASKGFHRVLFNPAKPVQARELTQLQTILQEQVKRHGDHVFKNGTMVIPGHVFYDNKVKYLKLESVYNNTNVDSYIDQLIGSTIIGDTNLVEAIVVHAEIKTDTEPTTLFIKYTTGAGTVKEFISGETMTCVEVPGLVFKVQPVTTYTGFGSVCTVNEGVFFVNGYFVQVAKQTITVSKYSSVASAVVGLDYIESIVTENEDESLYDNAFGFTNYGAPGAHRLKIELTLNSKPYDYTITDTPEISFIDLLKIKDGAIEYLKNDTQYAEIEKWLARRTYDESGNYVVDKFSFGAVDYRNNDRGAWVTNKPYILGDVVSNAGIYYIALNSGYSGATTPVQKYGIQSDGTIYWNQIPYKQTFINNGQSTVTSADLNEHIAAEKLMFITTSPGKAYVKGFEVNMGSTYTTVEKARESRQVNNAQLYNPAGSYVIVNKLRGVPNVTTNLTKLNLKDVAASTIGTAWVRSIEYHTGLTSSPDTVEYRLFLFGIKMNSGKDFVRDTHAVSSTVFSAEIKPTLKQISGSLAASTTTVTGVGTYFDYELNVGDRVKVGSTWAVVASIASPTQFTSTASLGTIAAGATGYIGTSVQVKLGNYIAKMPSEAINTMRDETGAIDTEYVISKYYTFTTVGTSYVITLTGGETFLPSEHTVVLNSGVLNNDQVVDASFALNGPATQLTISGLSATTDYKALVIVKRVGSFAKEKTKAFAVKTFDLINTGSQTFLSKRISLTEADCIRLVKVTQSGSTTPGSYNATQETNVTSFFKFDNGQRDEFYDVGRITTTRNFNRPLRVTFEYFTHSDGDYFSVDSYSAIPRSYWPKQILNGVEYFLPDCIDFRSRIDDDGVDFDNAGGASVSEPLHSEQTMSTSYSYYLPRNDQLFISTDGKVVYETNQASLIDGMKLADVSVKAYTHDAETEVTFEDVQIVTYTMDSIGKLDNRVKDIEYYVALTELEKQAVDTSVVDEFGIERTKNGILADEFKNHNVGDINNPDYKCSIDLLTSTCVPVVTHEVPRMIEPEGTTDAARAASNYQVTGVRLSLPYTEETLISQTIASRSENIQPYVAFDFAGKLFIEPGQDSWVDNASVLHQTNTVGDPVTVIQTVEVIEIIPVPARRRGGRGD